MRNKNGFTLVELLATIVILSLIILAATPAVLSIGKKIRTSMYCTKIEMVKKAGQMYGQENTLSERCIINNGAYDCKTININDLITNKYITPDKNNIILTDPRDKSSMNEISLTIYNKYQKMYTIVDAIGCGDITPISTGYDILFALNGGTLSGNIPETLKAGDTIELPTPIKTNYSFTGWTVTGEGSSITDNTLTIGTGNLTLTANWILSSRDLTINANGGTWNGTSPQTIAIGNSVTIEDPIKSGYIFLGWTVAGTGSTLNGKSFTIGSENATLSANWISTAPTSFVYTGASQTFTATATGYYKIELWGAQGGSNVGMEGSIAGNVGGLGGYSSGLIYLNKNDNIYIYIGGQGQYASSAGLESTKGYNGGGIAGYEPGCGTSCMKGAGGGGGATDIRLTSGAWNNSTSLASRIMIAGGGGGAMNWSSPKPGGAGGGLIGYPGQEYNAGSNGYTNAQGGTQITGGAGGVGSAAGSGGGFGIGGNSYSTYGGGGGSGYYGGGGGGVNSNVVGSGAGGSSFISGYAGVNAITSFSSTTPTNNTIHYSNKYFIDAKMASGINSGNGSAKITFINTTAPLKINSNLNNVRYIKDCLTGDNVNSGNAYWVEIQAIKDGINVAKGKNVTGSNALNTYHSSTYSVVTNGIILNDRYEIACSTEVTTAKCVTVDLGQIYNLDEIAAWHLIGLTANNNVTSVSSDNSNWTTAIATTEVETSTGKRVNAYTKTYFYTGGAQTFTVPYTGYYKIETWGGGGGINSSLPSYGAYTSGKIFLNNNDLLNIYVGGQGSTCSTAGACLTSGGYNGGGYAFYGSQYTAGGGGATDVRLDSSLNSRIMVAGGGGGNGLYSTYKGYGGHGGGLTGIDGFDTNWGTGYIGLGGSQISGGSARYAGGTTTSTGAGTFGQGGQYSSALETYGNNGGGGGYYGGGISSRGHAGGGGGSSYISGHTGCIAIISSSSTSPRTGTGGAVCTQGGNDNLCSIHYSNKYFTNTLMIDGAGYTWTNTKAATAGTNLMPSPTIGNYALGYGNIGNGIVAITYLGSQ